MNCPLYKGLAFGCASGAAFWLFMWWVL